MGDRILVLGDIHAPFVHKPSISRALSIAEELRPNIIIQIGDAYDMYSFSKFPRSLNLLTPYQEISDGRICLEEIWGALRSRCKKALFYQMLGNHDSRISKRITEKFPEIASLVSLNDLWKFNNVKTIYDDREELVINDIVFIHGYRTKLGDHARNNLKSTVCGHSHRGGVHYIRLEDKVIWELNAGYLADPYHDALVYRQQLKYFNWTHGLGFIDDLGPRFIPLL